MSRIKELKTNPEYNLNLISIIELFSPESKSKYTELLLRLMKGTPDFKNFSKEIKKEIINNFEFISLEQLDILSELQLLFFYKFIDGFFNAQDLKNFRKFCEYNERNLIVENDLTRYKTYEQITSAMSMAEMKAEEKELETQVIKIHEDGEWLLIRPLTFKSSCKYGANTKWCTTTEHNQEYYNKYSKRGVLIYCINKKNGYKVAAFYSLDKNEPEFSYWNQKDTRIDSTDSELSLELIGLIRDYVKDKKVKSNASMLDPKLKNIEFGKKTVISNRTASAVRREQQEVEVQEPIEQIEIPFAEERIEESSYENRENTIDRMQWSSTTTSTTESE